VHTQDFPQLASVEQIEQGFESHGYICSRKIATAVFLAFQLRKPVLVEGPPGVGKTELAKTIALLLDLPLIRLQCYEGLDESKALYEWKYGKQLLYTQVLKEKLGDLLQGAHGLAESVAKLHQFGDIFYSEEFLEPRPLLKAMQQEKGAILLIDEVDGDSLGLPSIHTRDRHCESSHRTHGIPDQQQYPGYFRCPQAALPALVYPFPHGGIGGADYSQSRSGCGATTTPPVGGVCALPTPVGSEESARHFRNHRLGTQSTPSACGAA
jgi:hypothetical protein